MLDIHFTVKPLFVLIQFPSTLGRPFSALRCNRLWVRLRLHRCSIKSTRQAGSSCLRYPTAAPPDRPHLSFLPLCRSGPLTTVSSQLTSGRKSPHHVVVVDDQRKGFVWRATDAVVRQVTFTCIYVLWRVDESRLIHNKQTNRRLCIGRQDYIRLYF